MGFASLFLKYFYIFAKNHKKPETKGFIFD